MILRVLRALVALAWVASSSPAIDHRGDAKLDPPLRARAHTAIGVSDVIVRTFDGRAATTLIRGVGGSPGRQLPSLGAQAARVADAALDALASHPDVSAISLDRPVHGTMERTGASVGARWVNDRLGLDGTGVGIATIDSGVTPQHDDLASGRVVHFEDFVNFQTAAYDDYGHGTHVAGIIAGSGHDSDGARRGVAPGSNLIVLKALDGSGGGYISNVIAALEYAIANRETYNIRVINLSVAAGVYESYEKDPLTLAAKRAVDAGIVVVAAAGNLGRNSLGITEYGGIASPGNAPWVLTIGATNHMGTPDRSDDQVAPFSSRGPAVIDNTAKPDLVAPGVGIESIAEPSSLLFAVNPNSRVWGTIDSISQPYLRMSGTSMSAPVAAGTIALMLQANRSLSPNAVKAILQFTAENRDSYDYLTQGAGFLNARGAVQLARNLGSRHPGEDGKFDDPTPWSRHIIWGNHRIPGGMLTAQASAWAPGVIWGSSVTPTGEPVVWGTLCAPSESPCDRGPWRSGCELLAEGCGSTAGRSDESSLLQPPCDQADCNPDLRWGLDGLARAGSLGAETFDRVLDAPADVRSAAGGHR